MRITRSLATRLGAAVSALLLAGTVSWFAAPSASAVVHYQWINDANGLCLNGYTGTAHAEVTLTPCSWSDDHMSWLVNNNPDQNIIGAAALEIQNVANGECLNGYIGTAHAQVTLTPCSWLDHHMTWYHFYSGLLQNGNNGYCLNGSIGTSHPQLIMTLCDSSDKHMDWYLLI